MKHVESYQIGDKARSELERRTHALAQLNEKYKAIILDWVDMVQKSVKSNDKELVTKTFGAQMNMYDCMLKFVSTLEQIECNKEMLKNIYKFDDDVADDFNNIMEMLDGLNKQLKQGEE